MLRVLVAGGRGRQRCELSRALRCYGYAVDEVAVQKTAAITPRPQKEPDAVLAFVPRPLKVSQSRPLIRLRAAFPRAALIVATGSDDPETLQSLLAVGADDFIPIESSPAAVVIRLRFHLDRATTPIATGVWGDVNCDPISRTLSSHGVTVELAPRVFQLYALLLAHAGTPLSARDIATLAWRMAPDRSPPNDVVGVNVFYLRRQLARLGQAHLLRTVRGAGYTLINATPRRADTESSVTRPEG